MSDEIIGTSVLQGDQLFICAYSPTFQGGFPHWSSIPIAPEGAPDTRSPLWRFRSDGDTLHCSPSVHILAGEPKQTLFHNEGSWSTPFIEIPAGEDALEKCIELNRDEVRRKKGLPVAQDT